MSECNGEALSARVQLREARAAVRLERTRAELATLQRHTRRLTEGNMLWDHLGGYSELLDRFRSDGGAFFLPPSTAQDRRYGSNWPFWRTWQEHSLLRASARLLCTTTYTGAGILSGLTSYVVGEGATYRAVARKGKQPPASLLDAVQARIDLFSARNLLPGLEQELFQRSRRDGEYFLRYFRDPHDACTLIRTVEPEQVIEDYTRHTLETGSYGCLNPPEDLQTRLGFSVSLTGLVSDCEDVPAHDMQHVKVNTDRIVKRGLTDFAYDVHDAIGASSKLLENMAEGSAIQAAISVIRQHEAATPGQVQGFVDAQADFQVPNPWTGQQRNQQHMESGTTLDIPKGLTYVPPPYSQGIPVHTQVAATIMRAVGVKWNAPEWLVSGDSGSASYATSLTLESPFVRTCGRAQGFYKPHFATLPTRAVRDAAEAGLIRAEGAPGPGRRSAPSSTSPRSCHRW